MSATATLTESDRVLESVLESDSGKPVQEFDALDPPTTSFPLSTTMPQMFSSLLEELSFVGICSMGQMMFAIHLAQAFVNQVTYIKALETSTLNTAWLIGSFLVANGVSVVISGSLADLINPKSLLCGAFLWLATWSLIGAFSLSPSRIVLFFIVRAMAGLAI